MKLKTQKDIPADWARFTVRKKTTVKIRPCNGAERFSVSWQDAELVSDPELDLIIIQPSGKEYPCKKDIFLVSYCPVGVEKGAQYPLFGGFDFVKNATSEIVAIPEGVDVEIETLEGILPKV